MHYTAVIASRFAEGNVLRILAHQAKCEIGGPSRASVTYSLRRGSPLRQRTFSAERPGLHASARNLNKASTIRSIGSGRFDHRMRGDIVVSVAAEGSDGRSAPESAMTDPWELPGMPSGWDIVIPTDDESITRRRRALAPIQVLTDIERTKTSLDGDFWGRYDLFTIALAVIDQVALAMGISAGRTWDETVNYAAGQAARQVPDAAEPEWASVAERVVVSLVYTTQGPASVLHGGTSASGLLYLHPTGSDGLEHLRASEQAINIFVEALDLDIEAAQIANEAKLNALIARGAVESAVQIARHARYRSIQYQERIRRIIADTLIDPDVHDWVGEVPALLDNALAHVRDRLDAESTLLDAVADRRTEVDDRSRLEAANQLIEILRECRRRHNELHRHLIGARSRLREALDDRFARPPRSVRRVDIGTDLLAPFLARPTKSAAAVADRLLATVGGMPIRWWPSLTTMTDGLRPTTVPGARRGIPST